jgi:hypothetical protein
LGFGNFQRALSKRGINDDEEVSSRWEANLKTIMTCRWTPTYISAKCSELLELSYHDGIATIADPSVEEVAEVKRE